jgi:hypothetical protein
VPRAPAGSRSLAGAARPSSHAAERREDFADPGGVRRPVKLKSPRGTPV